MKNASDDTSGHIELVRQRYSDTQNIGVRVTPVDVLERLYMHHGLSLEEIKGKTVLEIGAGCSQYAALFLKHGCKTYYANDLVPERIAAGAIDDPRFIALPGDFLTIQLKEQPDIIFCSLTMMFVKPLFNVFAEHIHRHLKSGGIFVCMDPNYMCPLALFRWVSHYDPSVQIYSPWTLKRALVKAGLVVERMTPVTAPLPWTKGIWPLGTSLWIRARKP